MSAQQIYNKPNCANKCYPLFPVRVRASGPEASTSSILLGPGNCTTHNHTTHIPLLSSLYSFPTYHFYWTKLCSQNWPFKGVSYKAWRIEIFPLSQYLAVAELRQVTRFVKVCGEINISLFFVHNSRFGNGSSICHPVQCAPTKLMIFIVLYLLTSLFI